MALDIKDEFLAIEFLHRSCRIQRRFGGNLEIAPCRACLCVNFVEREQCASGAAGGNQEAAPIDSGTACILRRLLQRELVAGLIGFRQGNWLKLPIGRRIDFDR